MSEPKSQRAETGSRVFRGPMWAVIAGLGYWGAAHLGLLFIPAGGGITPVWPPNGFAIGLLLALPFRTWPWILAGVALASGFANLEAGRGLPIALAFAGANTFEVIAAGLFMRGLHRPRFALRTRREAALFGILAGPGLLFTALPGATVGWSLLGGSFGPELQKWWLGSAVGLLIVGPAVVLLGCFFRLPIRIRPRRIAEMAFWVTLHAALCVLIYVVAPKVGDQSLFSATVMPYLSLITLVFMTVRFGPVGATVACLITTSFALGAQCTALGALPVPMDEVRTIFSTQIFLAVSALLGLYLGAQREERLSAEEAVRESEERFRQLTLGAPVGIFLSDANGDCTFANQASSALTGRPAREVLGRRGLEAFHPADRAKVLQLWRDTVRNHGEFSETYRFQWPDGTVRWAMGKASPLHGRHAELTGYVGTLTDITPLKEAEQRLRESEARFQQLADATPGFVWTADREGRRDYFNRAWLDFRGRSMVDEMGFGWAEGIHPDDRERVIQQYLNAVATQKPLALEYRLLRHDGVYRFVMSDGAPRFTADGEYLGMAGSGLDVTPLREAETERMILQAQVQESARTESIAMLAGGVAHEFNNLLTAMLGNANLAQLEAGLSTNARDHLSRIEESALRAADLTRKMLAFSGRSPSIKSLHSLTAIAEDTLALLRASLPKSVALNAQFARDLPNVVADASQLQQVLVNLFSNAVEALGEGHGAVQIATAARHLNDAVLQDLTMDAGLVAGTYAYLQVSDEGCGIAAENLERIFEPFYSTKFLGRGLGLAATRSIVRAHGGFLNVRSEVGAGTVVTAYFPSAVRPAARMGLPISPAQYSI